MVALAAQFVFELKTAGLADCDFHFRQRPVRQPAFGLGKITVLRAVDPNRNNRRLGLVRKQAGRFINLHQAAVFGYAPLGENHAEPAAVDRCNHFSGRPVQSG